MSKLFVFTMALAFPMAFPQTDCSADDMGTTAIAGSWKVVGMKARGEDVTNASWRGMRYDFRKETYTMWPGTTTPAGTASRPPLQGPYSMNNESDPHHIDLTMIAGESRREVQAIYKIADEKLYLCLGRKRPISFETTDTKNLCYILERVPSAGKE